MTRPKSVNRCQPQQTHHPEERQEHGRSLKQFNPDGPNAGTSKSNGQLHEREQRVRDAQALDWQALSRRIADMYAADIQCKTSALPPQAALELLVLRLCGVAA